jgi:hypothetical protein
MNVHNCLVDSGDSNNVMSIAVYQKLGVTLHKTTTRIIQPDKYYVKVIVELKQIQITLATNPWICQIIDIVVLDILEAYGMLLSRDWSNML